VNFLTVLRLILSVGFPPDVTDESVFRAWCRKMAEAALQFAAQTATAIDDQIAATLNTLVSNDTYWTAIYGVIIAALEYVRPEDQERLVAESPVIQQVADDAKLDPATIIMILTAVLQVWEWWRNRNE
jgi:hypothetical protein